MVPDRAGGGRVFPTALCFLAATEEPVPGGDEGGKGGRRRGASPAHTNTQNLLQTGEQRCFSGGRA